MPVGAESRNQESDDGKHDGDGNIASHVGAAGENGELTNQVEAEDEEKRRHQVGHILLVFRPDARFRHFISNKGVKRLDEILQTFGRLASALHGCFGDRAENQEQNQRREQHREHVARDAEIHKTRHAAAQNAAVVSRFGFERDALAAYDGVVAGFLFAVFFYFQVGVIVNFVLTFSELRACEPHHSAVHEDITVVGVFAVAVVVRVESRRSRDRPAPLVFQNDRQVEIPFADDVDDIRVGDVMHGVFAGVEFFGSVDGVAAVAMTASRVVSRVLFFPVLWVVVVVVTVLCEGKNTKTTENQCDPIFANGCHVHFWKGFFQIGGKGTMRFSDKKTEKNISPKKIGRGGYLEGFYGIKFGTANFVLLRVSFLGDFFEKYGLCKGSHLARSRRRGPENKESRFLP